MWGAGDRSTVADSLFSPDGARGRAPGDPPFASWCNVIYTRGVRSSRGETRVSNAGRQDAGQSGPVGTYNDRERAKKSAVGRRGQRCAYTTFRARTKDHFRVLVTVRSLQSAGKGHERCQPGWPRAQQEGRDGVKRKGGSGGTEVGREIRRKRSTVEPCVTTSAGRRLTCAVPARDTTAARRGCFDQG